VTRLDAARAAMAGAAYDLVLLELMLPDGRGIGFLKTLRARGDVTPVIVLTALDQVSDRIESLNAGADDYLVKPFDFAELSARIGSVARRYTGDPNPITYGPLEIDIAAHTMREWALFAHDVAEELVVLADGGEALPDPLLLAPDDVHDGKPQEALRRLLQGRVEDLVHLVAQDDGGHRRRADPQKRQQNADRQRQPRPEAARHQGAPSR
jgi:CheY-like chemotaxis protein